MGGRRSGIDAAVLGKLGSKSCCPPFGPQFSYPYNGEINYGGLLLVNLTSTTNHLAGLKRIYLQYIILPLTGSFERQFIDH